MRGSTPHSDVKPAMDHFKTHSGRWFNRQKLGCHWQESYWDHIISPDRDWKEQVNYIAHNPVRAGLVADFRLWPYTGSIGHDLSEILVEAAF